MGKCFREMQIVPAPGELFSENEDGDSCIPVNKVGEPYAGTYSYFETHFRLMREDLLSAYRESLKQLRTGFHHGEYKNGCKGSEQRDFQLYTGVRYMGVHAGRVGVEYGVSFHANMDVDWEKSKLLMNNSLLCVSQDGFMTFFWATVCNTAKLQESIVGLRAVDGDELNLRPGVLYSMFESTKAYHEAYMHVLKVLQRPYMECIRFIQQLVYLESNTPEPEPDFSVGWKKVCKCDTLDESQEAAIHEALTKNLAIIQGPPGTGKTFTGLLIVKVLLTKLKESCGPILIVCYTNRALDQFLEGIYAYEKSLARLGSRTHSTILHNRTLYQLMRKKKQKIKGSSSSVIPKVFHKRRNIEAKKVKQLSRTFHDKCSRGFMSRDELSNLCTDYSDACSRLEEAKRDIHVCFLSKFKVVGMTTTFAARNHELLVGLNSEVMVVEEAAEVLEGQILGCINPCIKHLILIGDHKQLRPSVASQTLAKKHKLDVSMFERLVTSGIQYKTLEVQRRMRAAISAPLISSFYPMLGNHPSVHAFGDVVGVKENVFFMDHNYPEDPCNGSRSNALEGELVVEFCLYLTNCCGYKPQDITILCMYRSQTDQVMRKISTSYYLPWGKSYPPKNTINPDEYVPKVRSVDEFQGEESNIILLSLVRNIKSNSDKTTPQSIGFLGIPNRICVALSRARIGLYIFGNARLLSECSQVWRDITQHFAMNGCLGSGIALACATHRNDFIVLYNAEDIRKYREGKHNFCSKKCNEMLSCGHRCPRKCHLGGHESFKCKAKCRKKLEDCGHLCGRKCHINSNHQDCFPCLACKAANKIGGSLSKLVLQ